MFETIRSIILVFSRSSIFLFLIVLLVGIIQPCQAGTLLDDFGDGNADGWIYPNYPSQSTAVWGVESGTLAQYSSSDHHQGLVDNFIISDQAIDVQVNTLGYAGIVLWSQNQWRWISVVIYPASTGIRITEAQDGPGVATPYEYRTHAGYWHHLGVHADSSTGDLAIYLDGTYIFTYHASTPYRSGLSGVFSGNGVGYFDDFRVTSDDVPFNIDIKPGDDYNSINLKSKTVNVAILSSSGFYAPDDVNQATLTFGFTGDETSFKGCSGKPKDVNGDTYKDLICTFTVKTAFKCNDVGDYSRGTLRGQSISGIQFEGHQDITTIPLSSCTP